MALAQLTPKSLCDLGPTSPIPDLSLPTSTRKEVDWSRGVYIQRAAYPWPLPREPSQIHDAGCVWVQNFLFHQTNSQRASQGGVITESVVPPVANTRLCMEGTQMFAARAKATSLTSARRVQEKTPLAKSLRVPPSHVPHTFH